MKFIDKVMMSDTSIDEKNYQYLIKDKFTDYIDCGIYIFDLNAKFILIFNLLFKYFII